MDKTQYYIPCINVDDLVAAEYNLTLSKEEENNILISTLISPLIYQIQRLTGKKETHLKELVQLEAKHNKKKHSIYRKVLADGFTYNGIHYKRFGKSAAQSKQGITVFVADYIYDDLMQISMLDIDMSGKDVVIPKYEAYRCLIFSTCTLLNMPIPNIVIVGEYEKYIKNQKICYLEEVEKETPDGNKYKVREVKEGVRDIKLSPFDGCGVHDKRISEIAQREIDLDYRPAGLQVRLPFMKGYSVEFDFKSWFREHGISEIKDVLGHVHKVDDIDCLWNASMFKGLKYFKDEFGDQAIDKYIEKLNKYEYKMGVSKYSHHMNHINLKARMNFQYLQCLDLINPHYVEHFENLYDGKNDKYDILNEKNDGKIISLAKYSTDLIEKIVKGDKFYSLKFLGVEDSEKDKIQGAYLKAALINDSMLKDPSIKRLLKNKCQKTIDEMRIGKIYGNGFYHTLFGDLIGYLEYIAGMEVKGVLGYKEFFTKTLFKDNEYVFSFRSPLVCPSEVNDIYIKTNLDNKLQLALAVSDAKLIVHLENEE